MDRLRITIYSAVTVHRSQHRQCGGQSLSAVDGQRWTAQPPCKRQVIGSTLRPSLRPVETDELWACREDRLDRQLLADRPQRNAADRCRQADCGERQWNHSDHQPTLRYSPISIVESGVTRVVTNCGGRGPPERFPILGYQEMPAYLRQDERDRARYLCRDGCLHGLRLYLVLGVQQRVIVLASRGALEGEGNLSGE